MGQKNSLATKPKRNIGGVTQISYNKWTKKELKLLDTMFRQMAQRSPDPEQMSKETFLSVYKFPGIMGERLFKVFDGDKSGFVNFEEFVTGLQKFFRGSVEDKADMIFEMYDLNDNGCVDKKELSTMLHSLIPQFGWGGSEGELSGVSNELNASEQHRHFILETVEIAFRECDLNNDNKLSHDQFRLWLTRNPEVVNAMEARFREHSVLGSLNPKPTRRNVSVPEQDGLARSMSDPILWRKHSSTLSCQNEVLSPIIEPAFSENFNRTATCLRCKVIYTFQEQADCDIVSMATDPDYSVFNLQHLGGLKTLLRLRMCCQCGGNLQYDCVGNRKSSSVITCTDEGEAFKFASESIASLPQLSAIESQAELIRREIESTNPDRIMMQGELAKKGRITKTWRYRWYVLKDKFLYHYEIAKHREGTCGDPIGAEFIQGCTAEIHVQESEKHSNKFCFTLTFPNSKVIKLWTKSYKQRELWVESLQQAAETGAVKKFYEIGGIIGRGKFSYVHSCTERRTNKAWAVKVIKKETLSAEDKSLLRTEISILRIVSHPYIVSLHDVYESKTHVYLIMTLMNGGDLFDVLKARDFSIKEEESKTIVFKILEALVYIHNFGIVHRDLKTENILVRNKDDPLDIMLTDFGLSKYKGPKEIMLKKVGTLAYIAPEVILEKGYSHKVDLWSLGCMMHLLLRGYLPFDAGSMEGIRDRILYANVTFNHEDWEEISEPAKDLLKRLLKKNPEERIDLECAKNHKWFEDLDLLKEQRSRMAIIRNNPASPTTYPITPTRIARAMTSPILMSPSCLQLNTSIKKPVEEELLSRSSPQIAATAAANTYGS